MKGVRLIQGFAAIDREARELMEKRARELRERVLAVAPEATFTEVHDETVIECAREHQEAVAEILRAQVLEGVSWSKDAKIPEGTSW